MSQHRSRLPFLLYGLLGLAVVVYLLLGRGGDRERIEKRLGEVGALVEKSEPESDLEALGRARGVGERFTEDFEVRLVPFGEVIRDRGELLRSLFGIRDRANTIGIDFRDKRVEVTPGPERKAAEVQCIVVVTSDSELGRSRDRYRFHFYWIEEGGEWWLQRVDLMEILEGGSLL